jgi:hypothetical protein
MAGRRGIGVLLLVTGEVLELLLRLCMNICRRTIHAIQSTESALIIMIAVPSLNIHWSDAPEIGYRGRVSRDRGEVILGHRKGGSGVRVIWGGICNGTVQRWARIHALLGLHSKTIGGVTSNGDPVITRIHVVGILLAMRVHRVVLRYVGIHGSIDRDDLVMTLLIVSVNTVPHAITPIATVRVADVMGRVHDLCTTVGVFEQFRELPPRKFYTILAIGGILKTEL